MIPLLLTLALGVGCGSDASAGRSLKTVPAWPTPVRTERPYLGVSFSPVPADAGSGQPAGALIGRVVVGGPAQEAGLRVGDVIIRADGQALGPERTLNDAVNAHKPGETIVLVVWRAGEELAFPVRLELAYAYTFSLSPIQHELGRWGLSLLEVMNGLVIERVVNGAPADQAGLMVGDLVIAINGETDLDKALQALLQDVSETQRVTFTVEREEVRREIVVTLGRDARP